MKAIIEQARSMFDANDYEACIDFVQNNLEKLSDRYLSDAYHISGRAHYKLGEIGKAIDMANHAIIYKPQSDKLYFYLGVYYSAQGDDDVALEHYRKALDFNDDKPTALLNMAAIYRDQKRYEAAIDCYNKMLMLDPFDAKAYRNKVYCIDYRQQSSEQANKDVNNLMHMLAQEDIKSSDALQCHFALGKIFNEQGAYELAFSHFQMANSLKNRTHHLNIKRYKKRLEKIKNIYHKAYFKSPHYNQISDKTPIFIFGLPRSGKTLLEHLIASRTDLPAMGELAGIDDALESFVPKYPNKGALSPEMLKKIQEYYSKKTFDIFDESTHHCLDTTPSTFRHLGIIHEVFKKAKFIHCTRQPLDHCLQIYFKYFSEGNSYTFNLNTLGHYYRTYQAMMAHWANTLPVPIYQVSYEDLVLNTEATLAGVFEYLELEPLHMLEKNTYHTLNPLSDHEINLSELYKDHITLLSRIIDHQ